MYSSSHSATLWHHLKHTGLALVLIALLVVLALLTVLGTGNFRSSQGAVPTGGLMAPGDPPVITHHTLAFSIAPRNGNSHPGSVTAPNGEMIIRKVPG
jgi:hypothetical protein